METDNYFYTDKKGKRFLEGFKNRLDISEIPQIGFNVHQDLKPFQILLTDQQLWIAECNMWGKPEIFQSFHNSKMESSLVTTGKTNSITFNWNDGSVFTAEIYSKNLSQARQIALEFPMSEEKHIKRSIAENAEVWGVVLFATIILVMLPMIKMFNIPSNLTINFLVLLGVLSISIIGAATVVRKESVRGYTGWTAVLIGSIMFLGGIFLLIFMIAMFYF